MITLFNVTKNFKDRTLFANSSFELPDKGVVALVGPSGTGKSTLLNMICGLDFDYNGSININGQNLKNLNENELCNYRLNNIGYVFQNFNLLNLETTLQNVLLPLNSSSTLSKKLKEKRAMDLLKILGIEKLSRTNVNKLSGGEKQRAAIARALINEPKVILCDEPTGALDEKNSKDIFSLLRLVSKTTLVIIATHDLEGVSKVADYFINIEKASLVLTPRIIEDELPQPLLMAVGKKRENPQIPASFKVNHAFQKNKSKKWRSLIMNVMLSLSLTGVGVALIIKDTVGNKINTAFSEIINGNQIVMSLRNQNPNTFTKAYNASHNQISKIYSKYNDYFDGVGVTYLVNFEDFFKDQNLIKVVTDKRQVVLDTFSVRNINDFRLINDNRSDVYYPFEPEELSDDEVVLGLPYEVMVNLCYSLQIQRNYTSLGHLIYENEVNIVLDVRNNYWQYDDQQIFKIVAVCESQTSLIYHTNQLWNEIVFEEMMLLPSDDDDVHEYPWEMPKIYYFKTKNDPSLFLNDVVYDEELYDFVFERTNSIYNPLLCQSSEACLEKRVLAYYVDKNGISGADINKIKAKFPSLNSYYFLSQYGYSSFGSNILSGFSKNVFVSLYEDLVDDAIDADTSINSEVNISIDLPKNVAQGNYLNSLNNGLKFSSNPGTLLGGRLPKNINEIVISEGLAQKLDETGNPLGKYAVLGGEIEENLGENNRIVKKYNKAKLLIVGIAKESKNYLYHNENWTVSFFRDKLGVSSFYLIPTGVVFEVENKQSTDELIIQLNQLFPRYVFENPLTILNENLDSTLEYANMILLAFSVLAIVISSLLLSTIIMLNIIEGKNEIKLFRYIGIKQKDINSTFVYDGVLQGAIAYIFSAVELVLIDQILSLVLGKYLNIDFEFSINIEPLLFTFAIAILLPFLISKIMTFLLNKNLRQK